GRTTFREQLRERVALEAPIVLVAVERKDLAERHVRRLLDPAIELDEADVQRTRDLLADGRLSGAPQAEQRDRAPLARVSPEQIGRRHLERVRQIGEPLDRDVAASGFEVYEKPRGDAGPLREVANGQLTRTPCDPHAAGDDPQHVHEAVYCIKPLNKGTIVP